MIGRGGVGWGPACRAAWGLSAGPQGCCLLQVVSAERGESAGSGRIGGDRVDFKLEVVPSLTNSGGSLHGGAQATLVDTLTTTALSAAQAHENLLAGDSEVESRDRGTTSLRVDYMDGGRPGETVFISATVDRVGGSLCFLSAEIYNVREGGRRTVLSKGSHLKALSRSGGKTPAEPILQAISAKQRPKL